MRIFSALFTYIIMALLVVAMGIVLTKIVPATLQAASLEAAETVRQEYNSSLPGRTPAGLYLLSAGLALLAAYITTIYISEFAAPLTKRLFGGIYRLMAQFPLVLVALMLLEIPNRTETANTFLAASAAICLLAIPLYSAWFNKVITMLPGNLKLAAAALGASRSHIFHGLLVPAALPGFAALALILSLRIALEILIAYLLIGSAHLTGVGHIPWLIMASHATIRGGDSLLQLTLRKVLHVG